MRSIRNAVQRRDGAVTSVGASRTRLLGWLLAVNSLAALAAVIGGGSGTAGAVHQFAAWCGIS